MRTQRRSAVSGAAAAAPRTEHLSERQRIRLDTALTAGDPTGEVTLAWKIAQDLRAIYRAPSAAEGRRRARRLLQILPGRPIPEAACLGRTLRAWNVELLPTSTPPASPTAPPKQ